MRFLISAEDSSYSLCSLHYYRRKSCTSARILRSSPEGTLDTRPAIHRRFSRFFVDLVPEGRPICGDLFSSLTNTTSSPFKRPSERRMVYCLPGDESPGYYRSSLRDNFRAARRVEFSYQPKSAVVAASPRYASVVNPITRFSPFTRRQRCSLLRLSQTRSDC